MTGARVTPLADARAARARRLSAERRGRVDAHFDAFFSDRAALLAVLPQLADEWAHLLHLVGRLWAATPERRAKTAGEISLHLDRCAWQIAALLADGEAAP